MLLNITNHPYERWGEAQRKAASAYGPVVDLPFPNVPSHASGEQIDALVDAYMAEIARFDVPVVLVQGEFVFTFRLVTRLIAQGIPTISACSERCVSEHLLEDGSVEKQSEYRFAGFRAY